MDDASANCDLDRLNRYWDAVVLDEPGDPTGLPASFAATVRDIDRMAVPAMAGSHADQGVYNVSAWTRPAPSPPVDVSPRYLPRLIQRPLGQLASAALLIITIGSLLFVLLPLRSSFRADDDPGYVVLASIGDGRHLTALDPITLQDRPLAGVAAVLTPGSSPADLRDAAQSSGTYWSAYRSGEALLRVDTSDSRRHVSTSDGITGRHLAEFDAGAPVNVLGVTDDGQFLVLESSSNALSQWFVIDPSNGRSMPTISSTEQAATESLNAVLDPVGRRLYRLIPQDAAARVGAGTARDPGPFTVLLVGYDLATGKEIGRLPLPHVQLGSWPTGKRAPWGGKVDASWRSQMAFSDDGRRIALFDPRGERITLVDAWTLSIAQQITLTSPLRSTATPIVVGTPAPVGRFQRPGGSGFTESVDWTAAFSTDGQALYVAGYETALVAGQAEARDLGVSRIDFGTGRVSASATSGTALYRVVVTADSVLTEGPRVTGFRWDAGQGIVLRRLDPDTLATVAERHFPSWTGFIVLAR